MHRHFIRQYLTVVTFVWHVVEFDSCRIFKKSNMKVWGAALILSIAALASAAPTGLQTRTILDDLRDFADILPEEQIVHLVEVYATCDKQFKALIQYVQSNDFAEFLSAVNAIPEVIELRNYLEDALGLGDLEDDLTAASVLPESGSRLAAALLAPTCDEPITGGLEGYLKDILSIIPFDKLKILFIEKMKTSPEFRTFIAKLKSAELKSIIQRLNANPDYQQLRLKARADVEALINLQLQVVADLIY